MAEPIDYAAEYDNSGRVANSAQLKDAYPINAMAFRETAKFAHYDLAYGPEERNKLDMFWPSEDRDCPVVIFIHGGYWQSLDRKTFSHMAKGLNDHGMAVAMPSYTLAPKATVETIINEMRRACITLYQTLERKLTVVGHSAGGHLAACMLATQWDTIHEDLPHDLISSGMGVSGLYDLTPLLKTPVNDALGMDEAHAASASPIAWVPDATHRFEAWVGGDESDEYHRQSRELADRWNLLGTPTNYVSLPGTNHFTIIDDLTRSGSRMVKRVVELVESPTETSDIPDPDEADIAAVLLSGEDQGDPTNEDQQEQANPSEQSERVGDIVN
ncbi:MAG: alpha/beta hydrolase [Ahrensia sp.]|nr:alpha/beta hydrolase [Ahrensia sp.]